MLYFVIVWSRENVDVGSFGSLLTCTFVESGTSQAALVHLQVNLNLHHRVYIYIHYKNSKKLPRNTYIYNIYHKLYGTLYFTVSYIRV